MILKTIENVRKKVFRRLLNVAVGCEGSRRPNASEREINIVEQENDTNRPNQNYCLCFMFLNPTLLSAL